jgi:hypothetical protein
MRRKAFNNATTILLSNNDEEYFSILETKDLLKESMVSI